MEPILALVAVENVAYHFDILYGYTVPDELRDRIKVGSRVQVNFSKGKTQRQGFVFDFAAPENGKRYKPVLKLLDDEPILSEEMISIAVFLKKRYFCTYYEAAKVQIPAGLNMKMNVTYVAVRDGFDRQKLSEKEAHVYEYMLETASYLKKNEILTACGLDKTDVVLDRLVSAGAVVRNYEADERIGNISVKTACLNIGEGELEDIFDSLSEKQKSVVRVLRDVGSASVKEVCYFTGVTAAVVTTLASKGIVRVFDAERFRIPKSVLEAENNCGKIVLTNQQQDAYCNLLSEYRKGAGVSLLYGITGSGKTSVFLKLIEDVIADGRQVIVMVPEISLTPQLMAVFKARFHDTVAVFHSALSMGERKDEYRRIKTGKAKIVVGTRSAVFAPFENIGLIVMDEEQEHTYKSESSPRYHARDVAKFRAARHNALLLLSSATPSVETFSCALSGRYRLHKLTKRYGTAVLPDVSIVDMKAERSAGNKHSLSRELIDLIQNNLDTKKQSILLINRRGYNTFVVCDHCSNVVTCPSCSISMTYHSANDRLMCHYCGYSREFSTHCPVCGKNSVRYSGYGTQRIEEELKSLFPTARVLRMDTDSASSRQAFEKNLSDFGNGEYDIMLGTQMVAKGLNFENVTLVGVINADQQLHNDDFRSEELTFDLLTQVVGRSGRGKSRGVALIQTETPENNVIRLARTQDYEAFYQDEIEIRKALTYPPFCDICAVTATSEKEEKAYLGANTFLERLRKYADGEYSELKLIVFPPTPPRISKVNNKYRYRIIIKCKNSAFFRQLISKLLIECAKCSVFSDVSFAADINPERLV